MFLYFLFYNQTIFFIDFSVLVFYIFFFYKIEVDILVSLAILVFKEKYKLSIN